MIASFLPWAAVVNFTPLVSAGENVAPRMLPAGKSQLIRV
jgi:hypothetical protein